MPENRYYVPRSMQHGDTITLKDDEFHYLRNVMRRRVGDKVELINGTGSLAVCEVTKLLDKEAHLSVLDATSKEQEIPYLNMLLALLKPAHLEYAIEKGTEVGVSSFTLFAASRSEKKSLSDQYMKRLETIILSSTRQCGRLFLPKLQVVEKLEAGLEGLILFGDLASTSPIQEVALSPTVTMCIGPEAGFTEEERQRLIAKGAKGVLLSKNTLRAETAAVAAPLLIRSR